METHVRGAALLILLAAALWGAARLASPVLSEALGNEGAIIARSPAVEVDTAGVEAPPQTAEAPLTFDEVRTLQWLLGVEGFLDPDVDVDGLMGPITEDAATRAKATFAIPTASVRVLLSLLEGRNTDLLGAGGSVGADALQRR